MVVGFETAVNEVSRVFKSWNENFRRCPQSAVIGVIRCANLAIFKMLHVDVEQGTCFDYWEDKRKESLPCGAGCMFGTVKR